MAKALTAKSENGMVPRPGRELAVPEPCHLVSGGFALLVQVFLLVVVLTTMLIKWAFIEAPQRPLRIWAFDSTKQWVGAGAGHLLNIALALVLTHEAGRGNECVWYGINHTVDTILGVPIAYLLLRLHEQTLGRERPKTGEYYDIVTGRVDVHLWLQQLLTWTSVVIATKVCLAVPLLVLSSPLADLGEWMYAPFEQQPHDVLLFVMVFWPAVCNSFQFYVIDNFLKRQLSEEEGEQMPLFSAD